MRQCAAMPALSPAVIRVNPKICIARHDAIEFGDCDVFVCSVALMDSMASVYARAGDASLSDGVQALAAQGKMHLADIGDGFWQDVDTPEMLAHAEAELARRAGK
jgi:NDP-sugar pyrophosphorylase family protein